ncbi:hypothetical protein A1D31_38250 [Bradyrhizobium liaoningense]|nr:hypothetical protein A1D31_38250 [Bradyrhizobium liaoningense]
MAHITQLGWLAVTLLVEPRLRISRARMGLVGSLLLVEAALGVASRTILVDGAIATMLKFFAESLTRQLTEKLTD